MAVPIDVVPSVRNPDNVDVDLGARLRADTGFTSYLEYLEACGDEVLNNAGNSSLLHTLEDLRKVDESYPPSLPSLLCYGPCQR